MVSNDFSNGLGPVEALRKAENAPHSRPDGETKGASSRGTTSASPKAASGLTSNQHCSQNGNGSDPARPTCMVSAGRLRSGIHRLSAPLAPPGGSLKRSIRGHVTPSTPCMGCIVYRKRPASQVPKCAAQFQKAKQQQKRCFFRISGTVFSVFPDCYKK